MSILARTRTIASRPARVTRTRSSFGAGVLPVEPVKPTTAKGHTNRRGVYVPSDAEQADYLAMIAWEDADARQTRETIESIMGCSARVEYTIDELAGI